jgi:mRNA interferase MazF
LVVAMPSVGQDAVAVCDQLRALDKSRLTRRQGLASDADMIGLEDGLRETLGL